MNSVSSNQPPRALLASRQHTCIFLAICLAVTVVSALNANPESPGAPASASHLACATLDAVIRIVAYGLAIGVLAQWRGNIRAAVLAHAAWDIIAGLGLV